MTAYNLHGRLTSLVLAVVSGLGWTAPSCSSDLGPRADEVLPPLLAIYRQLHAAPELSYQEEKTARLLATHLRRFGYDVHTGIGRYDRPGPRSGWLVAQRRGTDCTRAH